MRAKKYIPVIFILLLSLLMTGCDDCDSDSTYAFGGPPDPLKGRYILAMKQEIQSATDKISGTEPAHRKIEQTMDISVKDPTTLIAKFGPDGEPFYLDYDAKNGIAKGKDSQGYAWEIQFAGEHTYNGNDFVIMKSVKRTRTSPLGLGSDNMHGESKSGVSYNINPKPYWNSGGNLQLN